MTELMIPRIIEVIDAEMIRDGGSFSATLLSDCGVEYHLFIKVEIDIKDSSTWERIKYSAPVIFATNISDGESISWDKGLEMLKCRSSKITSEIPSKWLQEMIDVFEVNGMVPEALRYV